jgi:hypothetical protein
MLLPIYRLYSRPELNVPIKSARQKLAIACMAKLGFDYNPTPLAETGDVQGPTPFGIESLDRSGPAETGEPPVPAGQGESYDRALFGDPSRRIVASGQRITISRPATGCLAEAEDRLLHGARLRSLQLRLQLYDAERDARELVEQDPEFRAANDRWRGCLRESGFDADDPVKLLATLPDLPAGADILAQPAVRSDVQCKERTDYLATAYARLAVLQQGWIDAHASAVAEWNELQLRQLAAAREVFPS